MADENDGLLDHVGLMRNIVASFISNNSISPAELPQLITAVHTTLRDLATPPVLAAIERPTPAVSVRKSVTPEYLVCLEDGKQFKSLKRHLRTRYNLTPDEYRARWNLPPNYPMVAPSYADERSKLAKAMGLGKDKRAIAAE